MEFAVTFVPGSPADTVQWAVSAEQHGFSHVGIADSPLTYRELWVSSAAVACATERIRLGPRVTNPATRHPAVTASAAATLQELSGGRAFLGVGSGDSAVRDVGLSPSTVAQLEDHVRQLRNVLGYESGAGGGSDYRVRWSAPPLPIYVAASGPRMMRMAGRVADGVIIHAGLTDDVIAWARDQVAAGAREAGRDPDDVELWWFPVCFIGSRDQAKAALGSSVASAGNLLGRGRPEDKLVPEQLRPRLAQLSAGYSYESHVTGSTSVNVSRMEELGLTDYLLDRFAIAGSAEECRAKIKHLEAQGVRRLWMSIHFADKLDFIRRWSAQVMSPAT